MARYRDFAGMMEHSRMEDIRINATERKGYADQYPSEQEETVATMIQPDEQCFYCGDQIGNDFVYWWGHLKVLTLHPDCAQELGTNLIIDSRKHVIQGSFDKLQVVREVTA